METTLWTGYQFVVLGVVIAVVRYGLSLPPSLGRTLIRIGAFGVLLEAMLWLLRVVG